MQLVNEALKAEDYVAKSEEEWPIVSFQSFTRSSDEKMKQNILALCKNATDTIKSECNGSESESCSLEYDKVEKVLHLLAVLKLNMKEYDEIAQK